MGIKIFVIGKTKDKRIKSLIDDYISRIKRWIPLELIYLKEKDKEIDKDFTKHFHNKSFNVVLSDDGKEFDTITFTNFIKETILYKNIYFFVGGPYGFSENVKDNADLILSLSKMTFPHEISILLLTESLYRALSILKGTHYHH